MLYGGLLTSILGLAAVAVLVAGAYAAYRVHGNPRRALLGTVVFAVVMLVVGLGRLVGPSTRWAFELLRFLAVAGGLAWGVRELIHHTGSSVSAAPEEGRDEPAGAGARTTRLGMVSLALGVVLAATVAVFAPVLLLRDDPFVGASIAVQAVAVLGLWTSPLSWLGCLACGHLGLADVRRGRRRGRRVALAGLWLGYGTFAAAGALGVYAFLSYLMAMAKF